MGRWQALPQGCGARGIVYYDKRDFDRALADCTQAIQLDPKFAQAYINRGVAYRRKGDTDHHAIADFTQGIQINTQAIQHDPKNAQACGRSIVLQEHSGWTQIPT